MKGNRMCQDCQKQANQVIVQLIVAASVIVLLLTISVVMVVNQWIR